MASALYRWVFSPLLPFRFAPPLEPKNPPFQRQATGARERALDAASSRSRSGDPKRLSAEGERHERRAPRGERKALKKKSIGSRRSSLFVFLSCSGAAIAFPAVRTLEMRLDAIGEERKRGKERRRQGKAREEELVFVFVSFCFRGAERNGGKTRTSTLSPLSSESRFLSLSLSVYTFPPPVVSLKPKKNQMT
jgi:hypothetical protein